MRDRGNRHFRLFAASRLLDDPANPFGLALLLPHDPLDRLLDLLDLTVFGLRRGRFGHVNSATADYCAARSTGRQFRKGHTNGHKRCSLSPSSRLQDRGSPGGSPHDL